MRRDHESPLRFCADVALKGVGGLVMVVLVITFLPIWGPLLIGKWIWEDVFDV